MKKSVILFVALVVIVAVAFAACGPASTISGLWYEETGYGGTLEFKSGGVVTMSALGLTIDGTYTFDAAKGEGKITLSVMGQESSQDFTYADGKISVSGATYTKNKVEQKNVEDLLNSLGNAAGN